MGHPNRSMLEIPDVGVVAVTGDSWNGIWTTRHFMASNLTQFFPVAWLEPVSHWRELALHAWLPDFYRPTRIRGAIRAKRYERAAPTPVKFASVLSLA
jgi:hypothetical protein